MVHRNFEQTEEMVNNLLEMDARLDELVDMLSADSQEIVGPAPNLLAIHYQLNQLEAFRNQTLHQAKKASSRAQAALKKKFERLNTVIEAFDEYILELARNMLAIARAKCPEVIVKLAKIAEIEGKADEKVCASDPLCVFSRSRAVQAIAIRLVKKAAKMDAASKFKSMQADARVFKHYRSNIMKTITQSIQDKFAAAYDDEGGLTNPGGFLDGLAEWIYKDLIAVQNRVAPCFPPDWDVYAHFVKQYHQALGATLQRLVAAEPEASVLLLLHSWVKQYKKDMADLEVPPELLQPPLLDGKEQGLIDDYLALIVRKLDEWTTNLMRDEIEGFTRRAEPPELDAEGQYGMQGAVILFQMVNQQIDAATESGQGAILASVVGEVNRVMHGVQDQWTKLIETEYRRHTTQPEDAPGGLVEYLIALANDQIRSADFSEALSGRLEQLVSDKYRTPIAEKLNDAIDGYLDVAKKCTQTLIDVVFHDLRPATKQLFQAPGWYDGIMTQIAETVRDYAADFQTFLNPALFDILVEDLLDQFLVTYLTALANAPKLRMPQAHARAKDDISDAYRLFGAFKGGKELEAQLEVLEMVLALLEASKSFVFLSFWNFAKVHGPCLPFVEAVVRARGDFDRAAANEVMESIRRKVKEENIEDRTCRFLLPLVRRRADDVRAQRPSRRS
jgi:exocyst complex component 3